MKQVAGTILSIDDGTPSFLVTTDDSTGKFGFFSTNVDDQGTALASVLNQFHDKMDIDLETLRLSELTTCSMNGEHISLFVFDHFEVNDDVQAKAAKAQLAFVPGNKLHGLFHDVEFDSAPVFD